jgi:pimeloyl-ACP methyl ester carboxylesterase
MGNPMIPKPHRRATVQFSLGEGANQIHRTMVVHDWGDERNPNVVICVHGLSRNGRDFDVIADALSKDYRVLCPDVPGRGESDWLASVDQYVIPNYAVAMRAMLIELGVQRYDWIGTSMGGLIGMAMAFSTPQLSSAMKRFVINDVGPEIEREALLRIAAYMGRPPSFPSFPALFAATLPAILPFGPLSDEARQHIVRTSCQQRTDGQWEFKTDPKIGEAFVKAVNQPAVDLWPLWQSLTQPTLVLRGEYSDLLSATTLAKMVSTRANVQSLTIANTGHAPMMWDAPTIAQIQSFLKN